MYAGFTTTPQQDRERWRLMQKRAAKRAKQAKRPQPVTLDRLGMALAIKRQLQIT